MYSQAESALDTWRQWKLKLKTRPRIHSMLSDGLTNQNFRLETSQGDAVLRLPHPESELLGIDRHREHQIIKAIEGKQINNEIWFHDASSGVMISRFMTGKFHAANQLNPQQQEAIYELIQRYQSINVNLPKFDYVDYLQQYRRRALSFQTLSQQWEKEWRNFLPELISWQHSGWEPVLCHHDLNGKNIIYADGNWVVIDWEYAAMGHPSIDPLSCGIKNIDIDTQEIQFLLKLIQWMDRYWSLLQENI